MREMEGTWEEILAHAPLLAGRRVRLTVLDGADGLNAGDLSPAEQFAAAMQEAEELEKDMPLRGVPDSVKLTREARAGAMYGYDPAE